MQRHQARGIEELPPSVRRSRRRRPSCRCRARSRATRCRAERTSASWSSWQWASVSQPRVGLGGGWTAFSSSPSAGGGCRGSRAGVGIAPPGPPGPTGRILRLLFTAPPGPTGRRLRILLAALGFPQPRVGLGGGWTVFSSCRSARGGCRGCLAGFVAEGEALTADLCLPRLPRS